MVLHIIPADILPTRVLYVKLLNKIYVHSLLKNYKLGLPVRI